MNKLEEKAVKALRSNRYRQRTGTLRDKYGHCCLGVICSVSRLGRWEKSGGEYYYLDNSRTLPTKVKEAIGWGYSSGDLIISDRQDRPMTLVTLNDDGFTFSQIADIIEAGLIEKKG